jgi:hypothetical protein
VISNQQEGVENRMSDRLIKMDYDRNKVIVMRTFTNPDGTSYEKQIEMDLPKTQEVEGKLKKINIKDDGTMYETEEIIKLPVINKKNEEEEK